MANRITRNIQNLLDMLGLSNTAITALGLGWPSSAPTAVEVNTAKTNLQTAVTDTDTKEAAWRIAAQTKQTRINEAIAIMKEIDLVTDGLYTRTGAQKTSFGLEPWGAEIEALAKLIELEISDGPIAGSIKFDWENIEGASYEVRWYSDSALTELVGTATSTQSEFIVSGLTPGTQYWMTVTPHRGGQQGTVSDPATRVAPA
ncbi:MAG: fibronectin type III domain-containing protein [Fimbriimonadaceae bacterium]